MRISDWSSDVCSSDLEGKVSPCTRIVTCAGDRRICFPDGTDKLPRAHRQPGKALLLSIARYPLAHAQVPELPSNAAVDMRSALVRTKTLDRRNLTFLTHDPGTPAAVELPSHNCPTHKDQWVRP